MRAWATALAVASLDMACAKARPLASDSRGLTWKDDIGPLFQSRCLQCHSGADAGGAYLVDTYLHVLGPGTHASPDAVAGDAGCILVQTLDPAHADARHQGVSDLFPMVEQWVVTDQLAYAGSAVHAGGILNPADPQFHGELLKANAWNFSLCASCHGADFSGGPAQVACTTCHGPDVTGCSTCHGPFGQSGAHATHVDGGALERKLDCSECHVKPKSYLDVGHLLDASGNVISTPPAVVWGALAATPTPQRKGPPAFDPGTQTCSNVYCHGDAFVDANATLTRPRFGAPGTGQADCGTCHGLPPSNHSSAQTQCSLCHGQVVDASGRIINSALHINGVVDLGDGSGTCSACHGDASSPAPPRDLSGNTAPTALGVGAHRAHVQALHRLRGPIPCGDCHLSTPQNVTDPGHIDTGLPARVFPQGFSGLAGADGAQPVWDRSAATCSGSYCHGGGVHLADDASPGLARLPVWTSNDATQAACGTCHGIPPQDGVPGHDAGTPLTACANCHPRTMDSSGAVLVVWDGGVETSAHINGVIDAP